MLSFNKFFPLKKYFLEILILINFLFEALTGFFMLFYYIPSMGKGYESTLFIIRDVAFGYYFFNMHLWGANFLLFFSILEIVKIFYYKLYENNKFLWVFTFLFLLFLFFEYFTGILLPMENNLYWEVERIMEIIRDIPILNFIYSFFFGNFLINEFVHIRFYIFHSLIIPFLSIVILILIFLKFERENVHNFYFFDIFIIFTIFLGILLTLSILFPFKHVEIYNPFKTPPKVYLPLFILPVYFLKIYMPKTLFGLFILLAILLIFILPWIDKSKPLPLHKRKISLIISLIVLITILITGIFGFYRQ
ncbi:MAG: cytochrome b N-terminal domain-containing protein [candidate division WOR-3 bacterium]